VDIRNFKHLRFVIALAITLVGMVVFAPRSSRWGYDYKQGQPWRYETLVSNFDFPILKSERQIQEEQEARTVSAIPYYRYSNDVVNKALLSLETVSSDLNPEIKNNIASTIKSIYLKGVCTGDELNSPVIYIQKNKRASKYPADEVYKLSEARAKLFAELSSAFPRENDLDALLNEKGIYDLIVPNLIFDQSATESIHSESGNYVSPTLGYVSAGQIIVSNGEIVTADIAQMLYSYKKEYEQSVGSSRPFLSVLGDLIVSIGILALLLLSMFISGRRLFEDRRNLEFVLAMLLLSTILTFIFCKINEDLLFLVPFVVFALFMQAFLPQKKVVPVYLVILMPLLVHAQSGMVLFTMNAIAGVVAMIAFSHLDRGWKQFAAALITGVSLALVFVGFYLSNIQPIALFRALVYTFVTSMLIIASYPLVYLFEKLFGLVSNSKLKDLCETSNPLVHAIEQNIPGTFQHCLQVMNMSVVCARAIGENIYLMRAGALYHDIGKMTNPHCFVENESLIELPETEKYHYGLTPEQSARDIIRHVPEGVELAQRNNLPEPVINMILSHHGKTCVNYFYDKYLKDGGDPAEKERFCYAGRLPETKCEVILMMCDSLEAASRTLTDYSADSISKLVENIFAQKISERQFIDADITVREISIIKRELKTYIAQVHHERVKYPKMSKTK